jgi:hypothetical protein
MEIVERRLRGRMALPLKKEFSRMVCCGIPSQFAFRAPDLSSETWLVRHPKAADTHQPAGFL